MTAGHLPCRARAKCSTVTSAAPLLNLTTAAFLTGSALAGFAQAEPSGRVSAATPRNSLPRTPALAPVHFWAMVGMRRMLQTPSSRKKNSGHAAAWAPAPLENNDGKRGQLTRAFANPWETAPQVPA